ncbi:hypothetical protein NIIDMKKI_43020 [Mycobacterium kansasii]|uniref:MFS-type drug efflux transporter P55 n=1 Tax=Mycobacterium kansasii TaxID=1768 RepID=A0A1V3WDF9_MYCKA|nr:sugar (and other) transporter family protein [Mycobacterium kansasii]BCI89096.1 hypothetical protein NIIDMKKI_43020 [Mycobacterium kansasii]
MSTQTGRRVAISAGSLAVLLGALDTYVVVTIMRDIMNSVGIPVNQLQRITWIVTMYLLGYIAAMPLLGRASDRFGRKLMLQVSLAGFAAGSVITALAGHFGDFHMLIAGRTVQGLPAVHCCRSRWRWAPICGRSATAPVCSAASALHRNSAVCSVRCTGSSSSGCSMIGAMCSGSTSRSPRSRW